MTRSLGENFLIIYGWFRYLKRAVSSDSALQMASIKRMASVTFEVLHALRDEKAAKQRVSYDWSSSSSHYEDFGPRTQSRDLGRNHYTKGFCGEYWIS